MIALRDNLPLVQFDDGQILAFERNWLCRSLAVAANRAGYKKWWLAPHVTESVTGYLQQEFNENVIPVCRLQKAVQSVLQVIGYADVADQFRAESPPARISLADLARDAGSGYELIFFELLRMRLREAIEAKAERLEICDAHTGIKMLRAAKSWRRDCSGLLEDVVGFVRGEMISNGLNTELHLQVS